MCILARPTARRGWPAFVNGHLRRRAGPASPRPRPRPPPPPAPDHPQLAARPQAPLRPEPVPHMLLHEHVRVQLRHPQGVSQEKLPAYLGFFQLVHNAKCRGKALPGTLVAGLVVTRLRHSRRSASPRPAPPPGTPARPDAQPRPARPTARRGSARLLTPCL